MTSLLLAGRRIGLLTASASRLGGGVSEAVLAQTAMIREEGGEAVVFALHDIHSDDDAPRYAPSEVRTVRTRGPAHIGFAPALVDMLLAEEIDLLHLHGIWMYPSRAATRWAQRTGRPYVISPHGMLDPWIVERGRGKKALARIGYERASWKAATRLHALTEREAGDIQRETGRVDSIVIPNAGPEAELEPTAMREPVYVYLGRIHPKKNIIALVHAWREHTARLATTGARLNIAGWGEAEHVEELRAAIAQAGPTVRFLGPVYGEQKAQLLGAARFVILPSHSEGLPMVILEAWAAGTPAVMTCECNLPIGFTAGAAVECGHSTSDIETALARTAAVTEAEWLEMSRAAIGLASHHFSAGQIATCWAACYRSLIDADTK